MELKLKNYELINVDSVELAGIKIQKVEDFIKIFNSVEEKYLYRFKREEKIVFPELVSEMGDYSFTLKKKELNINYFFFVKEGIYHIFDALGYETLEDLLDGRNFDLRMIYDWIINGQSNLSDNYFFPIYYIFKESGCYPDFGYWLKMQEYGFGLQRRNFSDKSKRFEKKDFEAAQAAGFLKYGKEAGKIWRKFKEIGARNLEDFEFFLSLCAIFNENRNKRDLTKEEFDNIQEFGFRVNDLEEFKNSKLIERDSIGAFIKSIRDFMQWKIEAEKAKSAKIAAIKEKLKIFSSTWNEALESYNSKSFEVFIQKAFTAIEKGVNSLMIWVFDTKEEDTTIIENKIDKLREKKYNFPERNEIAYWRRIRNQIIHDNDKIAEKDAKQGLLFFKEMIKQIKLEF